MVFVIPPARNTMIMEIMTSNSIRNSLNLVQAEKKQDKINIITKKIDIDNIIIYNIIINT